MNKRRLLKLADLLEADAKNKKGIKFDLGDWARPSGDGYCFATEPETIPLNCGTTACAVGLACLSGAFKRSGLSYYFHQLGSGSLVLEPKFEGYHNFTAVERFFGLSEGQTEWLFLSDHYADRDSRGARGERAVAKRIRDFCAGKASPEPG